MGGVCHSSLVVFWLEWFALCVRSGFVDGVGIASGQKDFV